MVLAARSLDDFLAGLVIAIVAIPVIFAVIILTGRGKDRDIIQINRTTSVVSVETRGSSLRINVDGATYHSIDDIPDPATRAKVRDLLNIPHDPQDGT